MFLIQDCFPVEPDNWFWCVKIFCSLYQEEPLLEAKLLIKNNLSFNLKKLQYVRKSTGGLF